MPAHPSLLATARTGSIVRSRPGFGLEELGLIRAAIIHRDLVGVERPVIGDDRCVIWPYGESLIAAARKNDWETAAALAHRRQVSDQRNREIAGLFLGRETVA